MVIVGGGQVVVVVGVSVGGVGGGLGGQMRVETRAHVIERSFG